MEELELNLVPQPENVKINLFPHQLSSIFKMEKLENDKMIILENCIKETNIGINANYPGYGKTLAMLGLLCRNKMKWNLDEPYKFSDTFF